MHPYTAIGIDGCRAGWIATIREPCGKLRWQLASHVAEILDPLPPDSTILIDMIIGLPEVGESHRQCDRQARQRLRPHGSRIFPAPPRAAIRAASYSEACRLARAATGKAISKQCWHIFPKIRELDNVADFRIRESHPELAFARLNRERPVTASKKGADGQVERLKLLDAALPGSRELYAELIRNTLRQEVARDDALDALVLCAVAGAPDGLRQIPEEGIGPAIWY
ncbi:MAG: DUF429 domain-containing protein [Opitutales bacterium]